MLMTQLNHADFYKVPNIKFDIEKLRNGLELSFKKILHHPKEF